MIGAFIAFAQNYNNQGGTITPSTYWGKYPLRMRMIVADSAQPSSRS